jgi:hypothetical protein
MPKDWPFCPDQSLYLIIEAESPPMEVIAIFDIGKNNQKLLLFDSWLNVVHSEEKILGETPDDGDFACEDIAAIEAWMRSCLTTVVKDGKYIIKALNSTTSRSGFMHPEFEDYNIKNGTGMTDSSAALIPYLKSTKEQFILISTGIWCIFMNPFNTEPLTAEQLRNDTLFYMSVNQKQVKSSRFFLGHIHDKNVERLNEYFGVTDELYKTIKIKNKALGRMLANKRGRVFFRHGIPAGYVDSEVFLSQFLVFADAYHQLIYDLVDVCMESIRLILAPDDKTEIVYITGGFAGNDTFIHTLAARLPSKRIFTSQISDPSALGAAMEVYESAFEVSMPPVYLGLRAVLNYQ